MNEQLHGLIEHVRFPMMTHMALSHMEEEPFDLPLALLTEVPQLPSITTNLSIQKAYRYHLYGEEKFYKKGRYAKGAQCRSRRYLAIKWDPKKKATAIDLSKDHLTISSTQSCSHKTILGTPALTLSLAKPYLSHPCSYLGVHGFSSGKNSWEIKLNGQAGLSFRCHYFHRSLTM